MTNTYLKISDILTADNYSKYEFTHTYLKHRVSKGNIIGKLEGGIYYIYVPSLNEHCEILDNLELNYIPRDEVVKKNDYELTEMQIITLVKKGILKCEKFESKIYISKLSLENYREYQSKLVEDYVSIPDVLENPVFNPYSYSRRKIHYLVDKDIVKSKKINGKIYINKVSLLEYFNQMGEIEKEYMPLNEIIESSYNVDNISAATLYYHTQVGNVLSKKIRKIIWVHIESFINHTNKVNETENYKDGYYNQKEFLFGILNYESYDKRNFQILDKIAEYVNVIEIDGEKFIQKESWNEFTARYMPYNDAFELMDYSKNSTSGRTKFKYFIERFKINLVVFNTKHRYIEKDTFLALLETLKQSYSTTEVQELLKFHKTRWKAIKEEERIQSYEYKGKILYQKEEIHNLIEKQKFYKENYFDASEALKLLGLESESGLAQYLTERIKIPTVASSVFKNKGYLYPKDHVLQVSQKLEQERAYKSLSITNDTYGDFLYHIELRQISFQPIRELTKSMWFKYVYQLLNKTNGSDITVKTMVSRLINCTEYLVSLTATKEVYSVSSNEINHLFNKIPKSHQIYLYQFFSAVYEELKGYNYQTYNINRVINPYRLEIKKKTKEIYQFEEYKKIYTYVNNIGMHKSLAIQDVKDHILDKKGAKYYDSAWLYVLIHLNNAWRHQDVMSFPRIEPEVIGIYQLSDIEKNDISLEDSKLIVNQIIRKDLKVSKTRSGRYFYCSNDVSQALATAAIICEFRVRESNPLSETLINFNTQKNTFSIKAKNNFFGNLDNELQFSNLKMCRSLMTYIYVLLSKQQKGGAALQVAQRLRNHTSPESTNIYINLPEKEVNFLTTQVFSRGQFGYIFDIFNEVVRGENNSTDREEITEEIIELKQSFGDIYKVEATSGFINSLIAERKSVATQIRQMGLEEATETLYKLYTHQLISKESNYQCLVSEQGCVKQGEGISCKNCSLSIPNFYAVSSIINSAVENMEDFVSNDNIPDALKRKKANLLYQDILLVKEAIDKFGASEVFEFIEGGRDEWLAKLGQIPSLDNFKTI